MFGLFAGCFNSHLFCPREQCRSVPRGGVKKKKKRVRGICRRPREQYRSVSRGVVKEEKGRKIIGRGPRERFVAIPRFGINNALHGSKEHN